MASILKLLQTVDPKTRQYIRYYRISEIYEVFMIKNILLLIKAIQGFKILNLNKEFTKWPNYSTTKQHI